VKNNLKTSEVFLVLIGQKIDLEEQRQVEFKEGKMLADEFEASYIETSAKENKGIDELFIMIAKQMTI
jgi:GTPase SAR1 family protein